MKSSWPFPASGVDFVPLRRPVGALVSDPASLAVRDTSELLAPVLRIVHRVIGTFLIQQAGLKRTEGPVRSP